MTENGQQTVSSLPHQAVRDFLDGPTEKHCDPYKAVASEMFLYGALPRQEQFFIWKNEKHSCEHGSLSTVRTGITEPHRSEKTFKIIEFNHCTSTPNHVPKCHISTSFQYLQGLYQGFDQTNISANTACQHCREEGDVSPVRHSSSLQKNARAQLCTVTFIPCPACTSPFSGSCGHTK